MTLRVCLWLVVLATVFTLAGNQDNHVDCAEPWKVCVKEGDQAVLRCDVSALMNGQSEDDLYIRWVTNKGEVCVLNEGKSSADNGYRNRTEIAREKGTEYQYLLIINKTTFSDAGDYFCKLQKLKGRGEDVTTVHLTIQGHKNNVSVEFGKTFKISLPMTEDVRLHFTSASSSTQADVCAVEQNTLRPGRAYASRAELRNGELWLSNITFADEGSYSVIDVKTENIRNTVVLSVRGQDKNWELDEGGDLSISLCSLNSSYIEFRGGTENSAAERVCEVENGTVTHPAKEYLQRLAVWNGTLILRNLTAKDHGKYIVRDQMGGRDVLTLTLKIKVKPQGTHTTGWSMIALPVVPIVLTILLAWIGKIVLERCVWRTPTS
ncbi:hypothetical protein SKAU_G00421080 [Synaphobranchus kaupii]|uniref:Ig-like domain-containing protein n=1 Tax=Synaphobranchus kaupii TaxID=118154 RepID=A0A9Q1IB48_SYNKA|nr:hypothetical protein SKAU_G00421080 [Synaphobranchus kaupii]